MSKIDHMGNGPKCMNRGNDGDDGGAVDGGTGYRDTSDEGAPDPSRAHYSIGKLAKLAGVSTRTLRHYEDLGLLSPARTDSGYRSYSAQDARRLAQVLSMRACGLPLMTIRRMFDDPDTDVHAALVAHLSTLQTQGESLEKAIVRTKAAITAVGRIEDMDEQAAFKALKADGLERFEKEYGQEARERYGDDVIDAANERMMALTKDEWDAKELLEESIKVQLRIAMATGDPTSEASAELVQMHERWIRVHWGEGYTREAHLGLAQGYLADPRFQEYYDSAAGDGATRFLVKALEANL
ncbi:MAG: MerR family transcriptional regulator [Actinomycetota bacterium]|nr:MerR family transcriptional regulator [Actinomycetota bacterium]